MLLRFRPEDGLHVLVRGRVSVYEQRGQMQLVAETMEPVGAGSLQLAFEQLKERLKAEGLFDAERKRPLPAFPRTVGIVTSPTGAVIRDFLNIVARRHSGLNVLVCPVSVQGEAAPAEIEAAIEELNTPGLVDVIVLARGGGSLEDLAAFNSERVARAIAASRLPVVSAVGHETDFTIADFAADLRAPTPSAAAELITEAQNKIAEHLAAQSHRLERAARFQLLQARQRLTRLPVSRAEGRMNGLLRRLAQRLDELSLRQEAALSGQLRLHQRRVADLAAAILRHDPRRDLGPGAGTSGRLPYPPRSRLERRLTPPRPGWLARRAAALALAVGRARSRLRAGARRRGGLVRPPHRLRPATGHHAPARRRIHQPRGIHRQPPDRRALNASRIKK